MRHKHEEQQKRWHQAFILLLLLGLVAATSLLVQSQLKRNSLNGVTLGMTYSTKYAYWLGLDSHKAFIAMMDELGAKHFRLPVYWSDVEKTPGNYDWNEARWLAEEAEKRGADVTIAIGMRVPRYPECFIPDWAKTLPKELMEAALLAYLESGIKELEGIPSVKRFQVENEPYFEYFGECPPKNEALFREEIKVARANTEKPIMTTSSGEFGSWVKEGKEVDLLGVSLYRGAFVSKLGYFAYPIPAWYYGVRGLLASKSAPSILVSELQVEPWLTQDVKDTPVETQTATMSPEKIRDNVQFAKSTGFSEVWLWGPEWWYYLKEKHNIPSYWKLGQELFR